MQTCMYVEGYVFRCTLLCESLYLTFWKRKVSFIITNYFAWPCSWQHCNRTSLFFV